MSITVKKSPSFSGTGGLRFTGNSSTTLLAVKQSSDVSWTPAALGASLKLWAIGDVGITTSGGTITTWSDQSGAGNHLSQGTAALQPVVSATPFNGHTVVQFDSAAKQWLATSAAVKLGTAFVVARCTNYTAPDKFANYGGLLTGTGAGGAAHVYLVADSGKATWYTAVSPPTVNIFCDGVDTDTAGIPAWHAYHVTDSNPTAYGTDFRVGVNRSYTDHTWGGDVAEIIVCDSVLSAANIAATLAYLKGKYGTP